MSWTLLREVVLVTALVLVFGTHTANQNEVVVREVVVEKPVVVFPKVQKGSELNVIATAYTYAGNSEDLTYSEIPVDTGVIAVDPRVIPLGTVMWVEGYGYGVAADTGGDIKGNRIDVFLPSRHDANRWGRKEVKVKIIKPPGDDL